MLGSIVTCTYLLRLLPPVLGLIQVSCASCARLNSHTLPAALCGCIPPVSCRLYAASQAGCQPAHQIYADEAEAICLHTISAAAQFLTQPFVVGERVTLMSGGSKVVTGKVESIDPLNTVIRDDDGVPITIPNTVCKTGGVPDPMVVSNLPHASVRSVDGRPATHQASIGARFEARFICLQPTWAETETETVQGLQCGALTRCVPVGLYAASVGLLWPSYQSHKAP